MQVTTHFVCIYLQLIIDPQDLLCYFSWICRAVLVSVIGRRF